MRETLYCSACKDYKHLRWDRDMIKKYGKCAKCLMEADIGHIYNPPSFDCPCGKSFKTQRGLDSHQENQKHKPQVINSQIA